MKFMINAGTAAAVFFLLSAASCTTGSKQTYAAPEYKNSSFRSIQYAGGTIDLWEFAGAGDSILLINGGPGVPNYLYPVAEVLNEKGFNVIMYNQRGTGGSKAAGEDFGIDSYLDDIEVIRKELNIESFHLFGHSWGGLLAQFYLSEYPQHVDSLFLSNSSTGTGEDWKVMEKKVMQYNKNQSGGTGWLKMGILSGTAFIPGPIGDSSSRALMNMVWKNYFADPASAADADANWLNGIFSRAMIETKKSILNRDAYFPVKADGIPVMILYGADDIYGGDYDVLYNRFKESSKIVLEDSGHLPWLQNPDRYFNILTDFYLQGGSNE